MKKVYYFIIAFAIILNIKEVFARDYVVNDYNSERVDNDSKVKCWLGWKEWHFGATTPISKKGDTIKFKKPVIKEEKITYWETEAITNGYGYYAYDFSKHMLGLLTYMKKDISDYPTDYVPTYNELLVDEDKNVIVPTAVNMKEAIEITTSKILNSWYSKEYEETEFKKFWANSFLESRSEEIKTIQNNFHWKVYGQNAWILLTNIMDQYGDNYYKNLERKEKEVLKGVLLSIMDARYRNKNIQGKTNLQIKASEGELAPFLVSLKNLKEIDRKGISEPYTYVDRKKKKTYFEFPEFDDLIDGAYHYMIYYDADVTSDTSHSTVTSKISENSDDEEELDIDWESEYYSLTDSPINALHDESLDNFYSNCYTVKNIFKKSKENTQGIFGAEEVYDITSDVNFSVALSNMKEAMEKLARDVGGDIKSIFSGLDSDHIERTYLMAKNIAETQKLKDEYGVYNIGTNIITYTPGVDNGEFMLVDFQKIKLKSPLKVMTSNGLEYTNEDTDNDGIQDRYELGDATEDSNNETTMKRKINVTQFVKKMVERELYGNDEKEINENQDFINEVLAKVKYNVYEQRETFARDNPDNKQNRKEEYENSFNINDETKEELNTKPNEEAKMQHLKSPKAKLEVELWKYKSNPVLKDTDFDGIDDGYGYKRDAVGEYLYDKNDKKIPVKLNEYNDKVPKDNHFFGKMHTTRLSDDKGIEVDVNMDYRYFFLSNKMYYDELSTMSLLYANSIYMKGDEQKEHSGLQLKSINNLKSEYTPKDTIYKSSEVNAINVENFNNMQVKQMMEHFGFKDVRTYYMGSPGDLGDENKDYIIDKFIEKDKDKIVLKIPKSEIDNTYTNTYISINENEKVKRIGTKYKNLDEIYLGYKDTHKGRVSLGYKNIEYHGLHKTVIGIVIRGTAEDDDWDSDFDMGDIDLREAILTKSSAQSGYSNYELNDKAKSHNLQEIDLILKDKNINAKYDHNYNTELSHFAYGYPDWKWLYHHAGFDIIANRILEVINNYYLDVNKHFDDDIEFFDDNKVNNFVPHENDKTQVCFWVMGHSMGAGVANLVSASLISSEAIKDLRALGGNSNNVYCYTFAAPNTFYKTDNTYSYKSEVIPGTNVTGDYRQPKGAKYRCIFNIVNDDDFVPKLPMDECEWTRYGRVAKISIEKGIHKEYYRKILNEKYIQEGRSDIEKGRDYKYYCGAVYKSDIKCIERLIKSFNDVYSEKYVDFDMRKSTYSYEYKMKLNDPGFMNNKGEMLVLNPNVSKVSIRLSNARCYQKIYKDKGRTYQLQMPAFFLQAMAYSLHKEQEVEGESNGVIFGFYSFANRYSVAQAKILSAKILFGATDYPHYLESYYSLTKEISSNDFE